MSEELRIQQDRMRFTKNTTSSRLALLAIVFNVLFFISIYKVNDSAYYTYWMGISILYNLVFMLAAFLASEGAKNYNVRYSTLMIILGIGQIVRIFILPAMMHGTPSGDSVVMPTGQYIRVIVYLSVSALCLLAGAIINLRKSKALAAHIAGLGLKQA